MIELDEKDVRAVASRRYWARRIRKTAGYYLVLLAISLSLTWLSKPWDYFSLIPMLIVVGWSIWLCLGERKAKEELVRKWKEEVDDTDS